MIRLCRLILLLMSFLTCWSTLAGAPTDTLDHFPNYRVRGGTPTFQNYFIDHIEYPQKALNQGVMGTSVVSITITPAGTIADYRIITSLGEEFDEELKKTIPQTEKDWQADSLETKDLTFMVAFTFLIDGYTFMRNSAVSKAAPCEVPIISYHAPFASIEGDDYHVEQANRFYQEEKYNKAIIHLNELLRRDPFNRELYLMRGFSHFKLENPEAACQDFERIEIILHQSVPSSLEKLCP